MARCGGPLEDGTGTMDAGLPAPFEGESPGVRLFAPGTDIAARYEVLSVRGVGGSAVVYAAFDRELRQPVALKVLRADRTSAAALTRFRREAAIARQAASPRLVRVYDIEATGESVFLTMEDVAGGSLKDRLSDGPLPFEDGLRVAGEILEGLAALHGLGIVHRDVKPGNVLLTADGSVKLADFGLARRLQADETRATSMDAVVGTIDYVSPEQALGRELDGRSDLYSFGVTLYEALTGSVPFRRDSAIGTALAHLKEPPPRLRSVRPDAPAWLDAFVARLLSKAPEERYATAEEALADLAARRATGSRTRPRRRRLVVLSLALAATAAILVGIFLLRPFRRPEAVRLEPLANGRGVVAVDPAGRALWEVPDAPDGGAVRLYRRAGGGNGVAAVLGSGVVGPEGARIALLDAASGAVRKEIRVSAHGVGDFWELPERWVFGGLEVVDMDGRDALVLCIVNPELYPSTSFLVDPENGASRVLLAASGHSVFLGATDLDGDGRKELLFGVSANRLGQYAAVAAVRPDEPGESADTDTRAAIPPASPDLPVFERQRGRMVWFALGPAGRSSGSRRLEVDEARRVLRLTGSTAEPFELGFDGFAAGSRTALDARSRQEARTSTWRLLLRAARLEKGGDLAGAAAAAKEAVAAIAPAGDRSLLEWARRSEARLRIAGGGIAEGERIFREIAADAVAPTSVAADAARALHLAGEPTRALRWYRKAVLGHGNAEEAWIVGDALADALLAFGELRRWEEALSLVEATPAMSWSQRAEMRALVFWQAGQPTPEPTGVTPSTSLRRYWLLEERLAAGADPVAILHDLVAEKAGRSDVGELLALLEAELHLRAGRGREAWRAASPAFSSLWARRFRDVTARGHLSLAADRAVRAAAATGESAEAARIRTEARLFLSASR